MIKTYEKYYQVTIYSKDIDLVRFNTKVIVKKGLLYAKEIATNEKIRICDNDTQGSMYYYYVLSSDFKMENIVRYDEINRYLENFQISDFPMYSNLEAKHVKKLIKQKNKRM